MTDKNDAPNGVARKTNGSGDPLGTNTQIGLKLRQYYDDLVSDEVPDRFATLLKQLEEREKSVSVDGENNQ